MADLADRLVNGPPRRQPAIAIKVTPRQLFVLARFIVQRGPEHRRSLQHHDEQPFAAVCSKIIALYELTFPAHGSSPAPEGVRSPTSHDSGGSA